jgi:hypothetical protein
VKSTRYFKEVLQRRPEIRIEWCERAIREPLLTEVQRDGRIRYWWFVEDLNRFLRVVTLEDGETVHTAFFDRAFARRQRK